MSIRDERSRVNPWLALAVICLGLFMALLDTTIVNIAVPSIIEGIDASLDEILWVLNAYVLVYAALLITAGRLGDIFGPRNLYLAGLAVFTAASALHDQAAQRADQLPPMFRDRFVDGFSSTAEGSLDVGGTRAAPGIPAQVAQQLQQLSAEVFRNGFVDAMHPTLILPIAVVLLAAVGCFAIKRHQRTAQLEEAEQQPGEAAA